MTRKGGRQPSRLVRRPGWLFWVFIGCVGLVALKWISSRSVGGTPPSAAVPAMSGVFIPGQVASSMADPSPAVPPPANLEGISRLPLLSTSEKARLVGQYRRQGAAAFKRSDTDQALKAFLAAQELEPDDSEIFRWIERTREKAYQLESKRREEEFRLRLRGSKSSPVPLSNFQPARRDAAGSSDDRAAEGDEDQDQFPDEVEEYTVRPEDVLQITVYEEPDLTTRARVSRSGDISFPMLGHVAVAGLTVTQVQERLTELLAKDYLVHPQVQVFIETSRSVFVTGEVVKPGSYPVSTERSTTLMEVIALAGGFTEKADLNGTRIIRIQNGEKKTIRVRVSDITKGDKSKDVTVRSDDMIFVPESFF